MTRFVDLAADDREAVDRLLRDNGLLPADRDTELLLAREERDVVGCVGFEIHGGHGLLRSLAVALQRRNSGHGRRLVREVLAALRERGVDEVWLLTLDAGTWFAAIGFEPVDRGLVPEVLASTSEFTADACRKAICMRHRLES